MPPNIILFRRPKRPRGVGSPRQRGPWRKGWARILRAVTDRRLVWSMILVFGLTVVVVIPAIWDGAITLLRPVAVSDGNCRILRVIDGDTLTMWCNDRGIRSVRLTGFDTPELTQPQCLSELVKAGQAKWGLRLLLLRAGRIKGWHLGTDHYGRDLKALELDGMLLAYRMIHSGLARQYDGGQLRSWCQ